MEVSKYVAYKSCRFCGSFLFIFLMNLCLLASKAAIQFSLKTAYTVSFTYLRLSTYAAACVNLFFGIDEMQFARFVFGH